MTHTPERRLNVRVAAYLAMATVLAVALAAVLADAPRFSRVAAETTESQASPKPVVVEPPERPAPVQQAETQGDAEGPEAPGGGPEPSDTASSEKPPSPDEPAPSERPEPSEKPMPLNVSEPEAGLLNITGMIPLPGERVGRQIVLFFDHGIAIPLAPEGTPAPPFTIEPELPGVFRTGRNFVAYTLTSPRDVPPNEFFDIRLNPGIRSVEGKELNPNHLNLRLATFVFEPQRLWVLEQNDDEMVFGVLFPVEVDLGAFREHLSVLDGADQPLPYKLERGSSPQSMRLAVAGDVVTPVQIEVEAGLPDAAGQFILAEPHTFTHPADPFFRVKDVKWGGRYRDGRDVLIEFSKPVSGEDLKWNVLFTHMPDDERIAFEMRSSRASTSHRIKLTREGELGAVKVDVSKSLRGDNRTRLVEDFSEVLPPAPNPLKVVGTQWGPSDNHSYVLFLQFSSPVDGEELAKHLTILDGQSEALLEYNVDTGGIVESHRIRFGHPAPDGPRITLKLAEGLIAPDKCVLLEPYTTTLEWHAPKLYVERLSSGTRGKDGVVVSIRLNTTVNVSDLQKHLEIQPDVGDIRIVANDRNAYTLYGRWRKGTKYVLSVKPGVKFSDGSLTTNTASREFTISSLHPVLTFSHEGKYYFTMREGSPLSLLALGLSKADISVHRVYPSNLVYALGDLTEEVKRDRYHYRRREPVDETISKWSEKLHEGPIELVYSPDEVVSTNVPLDQFFPPDKRGVFCVVAGTEGYNNYTKKLVMFTNIGVLSHWQDDNLVLFAHNLLTLEPLGQARVSVYSSKKQLMHVGYTDEGGILKIQNLNNALGVPQLVVVEHNEDATFLELNARKDDVPEIRPGMPLYDSEAYDGYVYADRDLYRPGETAHIRWIVRTNFGDALPDVPLKFFLTGPRGEIVHKPVFLSQLGTGGYDFASEKTHPTGQYKAMLCLPDPRRTPVGSYTFQLEDFVPNRLKTIVELPSKQLMADAEYQLLIKAEHLFGASAADRKSSCEVLLERGGWQPEAWPGYAFTNDTPFTPDRVNCGEQQTDEDGQARYSFSYRPSSDATFPLRATVTGSVYELGGRVVNESADAVFFPSDVCLGVRANEAPAGAGVEVHVAAVKPDGSPAEVASVKVTLERQIWNYYIRRYYSHYESNWSDSYEEVETREVPLEGGRGSLVMDTKGYGRFRVRVHSERTPQFSTLKFHSYWYGGRLSFGNAVRPTLLKLSLDQERYRPGEDAILLVESPFDGRGVLVVQGERIRDMIPFEIRDNKAEVRVPVTKMNLPNLWLEVTALHEVKTERAQVYPFSSFAMIPLVIDNPDRTLDVAFPDLPEEIRPLSQPQFDIVVKDGNGKPVQGELTLAAVDEGIHTITDYRNPDPCAHFARPRKPDYRRAHYYDKVAYDFDKPGFGGGSRLRKRAVTIGENWIKPVALWSGVVETDAEGKASVTMSVPEFSGQLRLVAVACSNVASGAGSANVFVRRPFVLRTSMPRFLLPGDKADCTAVVFNTTRETAQAVISWEVSGPLSTGKNEQRVELPANGEARVTARFEAAQAVGQAAITWRAVVTNASGRQLEDLTQEAPMPIRPSSGFQSHHDFIVVDQGKTQTFKNERFHENEWLEIDLSVTADPTSRLLPALHYVVDYPYGCIEQTVSRLMPLYLLRSSDETVGHVLKRGHNLNNYIDAGIQRVFSMQTPNGGLSYWPGGYNSYPYGSLYALHFLTLAKNDRQFAIPDAPYQSLQRYARTIAADWSNTSESHLYQRAYALFVLALGGDANAVKQIRRFDAIDMPQPSRYLLAAALAHATDDADRVKMYLSEMPSVPYEVVEQTASLSSDIRNKAVELMALRKMGGDPDEIHARAETLIRFLEKRRHGNTQETAFVITALCEYLGELTDGLVAPSATIDGPSGAKTVSGLERFRDRRRGGGNEYTITNTGQAPMFVNVTTRGFLKNPNTNPVREGVGVERVILGKDGKPHEGQAFDQSDTYIVHLTIHADAYRENLVVVDMLPAGFEIENPRLTKDVPKLTNVSRMTPSYTDIRDDRIILAMNRIGKGTYHYDYVVRAVTPGEFQYPAAAAECMYDAEIHGASAPASISVSSTD